MLLNALSAIDKALIFFKQFLSRKVTVIIMPIEFNNNIFHIYNDSISYCIELSKYKDLLHIYYGKRIDSNNIYILKRDRASFSAYEGQGL